MKKRQHKRLGKVTIKNRTVSNNPTKKQGKLEAASKAFIVSSKRGSQGRSNNPRPGEHTIKFRTIPCTAPDQVTRNTKVVVFCHFYYDDLLNEIFDHIDKLPCKVNNLWVSLPCRDPKKPDKKTHIKHQAILERYPDANVRIVRNKGKDIGGKLVCLRDYLRSSKSEVNDWLIFCHDKKSPHMPRKNADLWRRDLLHSIFAPKNVHKALCCINKDDSIKMWGGRVREGIINSKAIAVHLGNVPKMYELCKSFGMRNLPFTGAFIGGTMFWVNDKFFRNAFRRIHIDGIIEKLENGDVQEPSITHAVERFFGITVTSAGYKIGSV